MVSDDKIYQMQGINDQLVNTLGSTTLNVSINNAICKTEFQVVDSSFPISGDGILGNPFLKDNQIIIDVSKGELTTKSNDTTTIPARHEMIIPIQFDVQNSSEQPNVLIHSQKIEGDQMTYTNAVHHEIKTPGVTQPIHQKPYRLPYAQKEEIAKQVGEMQRDGIITPSDSPWNAPLLIVPKKSDDLGKKKYRVVVDFRKLNSTTVGDAFPMPNITEILDQLGKAKYFTCLDMASGYHQIKLHPDDREKTGFSTDQGHFEFQRMCFGLKGVPATFQRLMNQVLTGLNDKGVKPDLKITDCVSNFSTPKTEKDVRSFLGLAGYNRRFIPNFSLIAKPLTTLLKKDTEFIWTDLCQNAFLELKQLLSQQTILQYPDFSRPFIVTTNART
ncbi:hypothetical protein QTP88_029012 [Uroleucon formosanum]